MKKAGLLAGTALLALSSAFMEAADLDITLKQYDELSPVDKISYIDEATIDYATELMDTDDIKKIKKAACVVGDGKADIYSKTYSVDNTLNKYIAKYPEYPAKDIVRKTYDALCGQPTTVTAANMKYQR